ncbi:transcriptional regulator [Actinomadura craniellae]|uniref:Transcriptional regulator n=1 Tax=Actinomadura craniellae TaxID=2231787 RepID=A0A365GVV2_9ACTN|nr:helix-turn-helix domain-containing protein [Actinomadura craniellae]RAY10930.1 transcriptional regulator [Actinomadura craniellae]
MSDQSFPGGHDCRAREIVDRVGDKWSLYVIATLGEETLRFTELKRRIDGISQRMLTVTLRNLERDGIIVRTMYPVMPPRVEYSVTPLGCELLGAVTALVGWAETRVETIEKNRAAYDERAAEQTEAFG